MMESFSEKQYSYFELALKEFRNASINLKRLLTYLTGDNQWTTWLLSFILSNKWTEIAPKFWRMLHNPTISLSESALLKVK